MVTIKIGNTEHKEEGCFALYTEKIVPKPSVKYRRLIRAAKFFAAAVLFGLIASGVMLLVYPALEKRMVQRNTDKEILTIEKDEYPSEEQDNRKPNNNNVHYPYYRRILLFKRDNHKGRYKTVVLIRTEYNQSCAYIHVLSVKI